MRPYIKNSEFDRPDDMKKIIKYLNENGTLQVSAKTLERLYEEFSSRCCAGWLIVDDESLQEFADWLARVDI